MNCRKGDLAVITKGRSAGLFVTCLRLVPADEMPEELKKAKAKEYWEIDAKISWCNVLNNGNRIEIGDFPICADSNLIPIRPDELADNQVEIEIREELIIKPQEARKSQSGTQVSKNQNRAFLGLGDGFTGGFK